MQTATQPQYPTGDAAAESFGRIARTVSLVPAAAPVFPARSANDPDFAAGDDPLQRTLAGNGFGVEALTRSGGYEHLSSTALDAAARSHRAAGLAAAQRALFAAVVDGVKHLLERFRQRQQVRATCRALWALDDHTLRDIGLARCEIPSLAQEFADPAATRVRAMTSHRGC